MQPEMQKLLRVPANMQAPRYRPPVDIAVPAGMETPFIHPDDPQSKQLQQVWTAKVRVFNMSTAQDVIDYEAVWQRACDGLGHVSESRTDYNKEIEAYVVFCRWSEVTFKLPPTQMPPSPLPPST